MDQAWTHRSDWHEQVGCSGNRSVHVGRYRSRSLFNSGYTDPESVDRLLENRCGSVFRWDDWVELDRLGTSAGDALGHLRLKVC